MGERGPTLRVGTGGFLVLLGLESFGCEVLGEGGATIYETLPAPTDIGAP